MSQVPSLLVPACIAGQEDIDPRASLSRQTQLQLTARAIQWLSERLEHCFQVHGGLSEQTLAKLDWRKLPN
jgi:hypothetical protein